MAQHRPDELPLIWSRVLDTTEDAEAATAACEQFVKEHGYVT